MFKRVVMIIVVLLFAVFVLQNTQVVEVRFLFWQTEASRAIVLIITFAGGLVTGWFSRSRRKKTVVQNNDTQENSEKTDSA
jgi:uncharacterized integral membrane protein